MPARLHMLPGRTEIGSENQIRFSCDAGCTVSCTCYFAGGRAAHRKELAGPGSIGAVDMGHPEGGTRKSPAHREAQDTEVHIVEVRFDTLLGNLAEGIGYTAEDSTLGCHTAVRVQGHRSLEEADDTPVVLPMIHSHSLEEADMDPVGRAGKVAPGIAGTGLPE